MLPKHLQHSVSCLPGMNWQDYMLVNFSHLLSTSMCKQHGDHLAHLLPGELQITLKLQLQTPS